MSGYLLLWVSDEAPAGAPSIFWEADIFLPKVCNSFPVTWSGERLTVSAVREPDVTTKMLQSTKRRDSLLQILKINDWNIDVWYKKNCSTTSIYLRRSLRRSLFVLLADDWDHIGPVGGLHQHSSDLSTGDVERGGAVLVRALDAGAAVLIRTLAVAENTSLQKKTRMCRGDYFMQFLSLQLHEKIRLKHNFTG